MTTKDTFEDTQMPLMDHLLELRSRLLYTVVGFCVAFVVCYIYSQELFNFLIHPLSVAFHHDAAEQGRRLIYTGMAEAFITYIRVSLFAAFFISFPVLASQLWLFIAPGLYKKEKKAFLPFLIVTPFLFLLGAAFAYFFIIPMAWSFFIHFESQSPHTFLPIQLEARVSEYLSLTMQMLLAFGICFQLPIFLVLLARAGILTSQAVAEKRRFVFIGILIVSAFLTPPDVLSMIGLAVPLYGLFELSIPLMKWAQKRLSQE